MTVKIEEEKRWRYQPSRFKYLAPAPIYKQRSVYIGDISYSLYRPRPNCYGSMGGQFWTQTFPSSLPWNSRRLSKYIVHMQTVRTHTVSFSEVGARSERRLDCRSVDPLTRLSLTGQGCTFLVVVRAGTYLLVFIHLCSTVQLEHTLLSCWEGRANQTISQAPRLGSWHMLYLVRQLALLALGIKKTLKE